MKYAHVLGSGTAMVALITHAPTSAQTRSTADKAAAEIGKPTRRDRTLAADRPSSKKDSAEGAGAGTNPTPSKTVEGSSTVSGGDIIVVGLRQSVQNSLDRKRKARQIVDVITAEDAGKLPDNNVVEAMARITGVSVTRADGRANGFTIRGLDGVQTTVNGNDAAGAGGRTLNLASVPADLVKSIEVYKSRTADQPAGGIAGTVNIELRRPLDLRRGWTVAGSFRETYNEQGATWSPFASGLIAKRFDTSIGEMGFLVNGSWSRLNYDEAFSTSESPQGPGGLESVMRLSIPADRRANAVAPFAAQFGRSAGGREQRSIAGAFQWKPNESLSFVLEGNYFEERNRNSFANLYVATIRDFYTVENPRFGGNNVLLGYDISLRPDADGVLPNGGQLDVFAGGNHNRNTAKDRNFNFVTRWERPGFWLNVAAQYSSSDFTNHSINAGVAYEGLSRLRVDFDSSNIPGGGPFFDFGAISPTDPARARLASMSDDVNDSENRRFASQIDLWKELSQDSLLRSLKLGYRFERFENAFQTSYRYAGWNPDVRPALIGLNNVGINSVTITPEIRGGKSISWLQLNTEQMFDRWAEARTFLIANNPSFLDGPGRDRPASTHFATGKPNSGDPTFAGNVDERNLEAYAMVDYAFKAVFPIDGNLGVRYVNNIRSLVGNNTVLGAPVRDPVTNLPIPGQFGPTRFEQFGVSANQSNVLPSAFVMVHFTPKLQLRGSYSYNVQQPGLGDLRNYRSIDFVNTGAPVFAGNPNLRATTTDDYNASLEWYFGRGGIISLTSFWKHQTGFIYFTGQTEPVPELANATRTVFRPRNAGPGRTQGFEGQATGFFSFLPGFLRNLGGTVNATFIPTAEVSLPREVDGQPGVLELIPTDSPFTSRWTYNVIGYYETPQFGVRVAYNRRSTFKNGADAFGEAWIQSTRPTQRLDAAITYTPFKFLTFSLEGQNLMRNIDQAFYYRYPDLPVGIRSMGRTFVLGARARF